MSNTFIAMTGQLSPEWATFLLAAVPIGELRAALPLGVNVFNLPLWEAFFVAYLGNLLPLVFVFAALPPVVRIAEARIPVVRRLLHRYFRALERRYGDRYDRYGQWFLILLVAIPLPTSGVWTASVIAVLFDIEKRYSIPAILIGLLIAGFIVAGLTSGVMNQFV